MPQRQQQHRQAHWHPEEIALGLVAQRVDPARRDLVQGRIHLLQALAVVGLEEAPAGGLRNVFEQAEIDLVIAARLRVAHADGVDADVMLRGQGGGALRRHRAAGVVAVGQQDQHLVGFVHGIQHADGQADGVADGGIGPGHANRRVPQQQLQRRVVQRQRRLRIGGRAEYDQPQPVVAAPGDEVRHHGLHRAPAADRAPLRVAEIRAVHGLRNIERQQHVAHRPAVRERRLHPLRPCQRQHQQQPDRHPEPRLGAAARRFGPVRRAAGERGDLLEERHAQRRAGGSIGRQQAPGDPGQGRQRQQPRIFKPPHGAAPSRRAFRAATAASAPARGRAGDRRAHRR